MTENSSSPKGNLFYMGPVFAQAYLNSATPSNAISGFKETGILNCVITVFTDLDFASSTVTDINQTDIN